MTVVALGGALRCPVPAIRYSGAEFPTEGVRHWVCPGRAGVDDWVPRSSGPEPRQVRKEAAVSGLPGVPWGHLV